LLLLLLLLPLLPLPLLPLLPLLPPLPPLPRACCKYAGVICWSEAWLGCDEGAVDEGVLA
jgi:hypothetical protein